MKILKYIVVFCLLLLPLLTVAESTPPPQASLDEQVQDLKKTALELNRDLFLLEEDLLFPSNTQISVFLSLNIGEFFTLNAVKLKIDDEDVANYLYSDRETDALARGGVQRLYIGNLRTGEHKVVASFNGKGPHDREYKNGVTVTITKDLKPKYVELKIVDKTGNLQPEFTIKEW